MNVEGSLATAARPPVVRLRLTVQGAVQGVGFRPWIFRRATDLGLAGCVRNTAQGVCVDIEGSPEVVASFLLNFESEAPPLCVVTDLAKSWIAPTDDEEFTIEASSG